MISFVVPAYNEELELPATMAAIRQSAQDRQYELIVVDDASTDATAEVAARAGARIISINRRQIAAARNAGARAALGQVLFFVDADTRINRTHVAEAIAALEAGYAGGSAHVLPDGFVPFWGRIFLRAFSAIYFGLNFGAGAFLFTTSRNFAATSGFDERYFIGEEVYFSLALRKMGRFKVLREPVLTSGRKLRMYTAKYVFARILSIIIRGPRAAQSRARLDLWYDGKRESCSGGLSPPGRRQSIANSALIEPPLQACQTSFIVYTGPSFMAEKTESSGLTEFQLHEKDTGSADVQVALLTRRIEHLTEHLKTNLKDHSSRRGLLKMVAQRRSLLDYLSKTKGDRYKKVIDKLNLRK